MKRIVIMASGGGSNAEAIMQYFAQSADAEVVAVVTNRAQAGVIARAQALHVPVLVLSNQALQQPTFVDLLRKFRPDLIVLAGFLQKIQPLLIEAYRNQIVNIHPSLLPAYGGQGMYGMHVHRAVFENGEAQSGISIHYVDEHYDEGAMVFQKSVSLAGCQSPEEVAERVLELEHRYYPEVIAQLLAE